MKETTINGITVQYTDTDRFLIEVGRGTKGAYSVRYAPASPGQAVALFNAINVGNGYKKRLRFKTITLARVTSWE